MPAFVFTPAAYGPAVAALVPPPDFPVALGPGTPLAANVRGLRAFDLLTDLGRPVVDVETARACHAGLWLANDFLDESHTISQDLPSATGSFWHAVMHRREPDAFNSKYWWRKVGPHPVLDQLGEQAPALGYTFTNPFDFVDFCEQVRGSGTPDEGLAERVQWLEFCLLFDHCFHASFGA